MILEFKNEIIGRMQESLTKIESCLALLSEDEVWVKHHSVTNSVGVLLLHLSGNIRQYAIAGLTESADQRNRAEEFTADHTHNSTELFNIISDTIKETEIVIKNLSEDQLRRVYRIQGFELTGVSVCVHVTEHLSYHVGQIALLTKLLTQKDLGFYADLDADSSN